MLLTRQMHVFTESFQEEFDAYVANDEETQHKMRLIDVCFDNLILELEKIWEEVRLYTEICNVKIESKKLVS